MRINKWVTWAACSALGAAQANAGQPVLFERPVEGSHVTLYAQQAGAPDVRRLDKELGDVARLLGEHQPPKVQLYYYGHASDVAVATGIYAGGVTLPGLGQIHSTAYRLRHEMVHLVASRLGGDPGAFYQEGLAVALGDGGRHNDGRRVDDVARALLRGTAMSELIAGFNAANPQEAYAIAGSFMRFLLKTHGNERVVRFFRASGKGSSADAYREAFGETVEVTGSQWMRRLFGGKKTGPPAAVTATP